MKVTIVARLTMGKTVSEPHKGRWE